MYHVILEIYMLLMGQVWHTETEQRWNYVFVHVLPAYFSFNMSFFLGMCSSYVFLQVQREKYSRQ
jgi:hypothetical protein